MPVSQCSFRVASSGEAGLVIPCKGHNGAAEPESHTGCSHDMSPTAVQDEIINAVTGIRHIPPHHAEAMTASEAYRQA